MRNSAYNDTCMVNDLHNTLTRRFKNIDKDSLRMEQQIDALIQYMHEKKNTSKNTELSYRRDLLKLIAFLQNDLGRKGNAGIRPL